MLNFNSIAYGIKHGGKNLYKNGRFSLASISTIAACLFLFGIFYFILANLQYNIDQVESNVGITVLFEEGIAEEDIQAIGGIIEENVDIASIVYTSADEAWESFKTEFPQELVETFGEDNPLADSASYTITLKDLNKQESAATYIEAIPGVRKVKRSVEVANKFTTFNKFIGIFSGAVIILLLGISIFLINTTVSMGITVRREEISIMKLIGASDFFVRGPFIIEGLLLGVIGAAIPLAVLYFLYEKIMNFVSSEFSVLSLEFLSMNQIYSKLVPIALCIGLGIGLCGSLLTVRRHIKI